MQVAVGSISSREAALLLQRLRDVNRKEYERIRSILIAEAKRLPG